MSIDQDTPAAVSRAAVDRGTTPELADVPDETANSGAGAVTIAYIHDVEVSHSWHLSLMSLVGYDLANESRIIRGGWVAVRMGTDALAHARNKAVQQFLETDSEWLWWVDTDMGFEPDTIDRLVQAADPAERPIVGALCFSWREVTEDGMGGYRCLPRPTIFDWRTRHGETGFLGRSVYAPNSLVQCSGTGSACILIHRSVLEKIQAEYGDEWYTQIPNPSTGGNLVGEDLSFCMRAGAIGAPVFVHTGVGTTHHKNVWVSEMDYFTYSTGAEMLRAQAEAASDAS